MFLKQQRKIGLNKLKNISYETLSGSILNQRLGDNNKI